MKQGIPDQEVIITDQDQNQKTEQKFPEKIGNLPGLTELIKAQHDIKNRLIRCFNSWDEYWAWYQLANELALGEMPKDRNPLMPDGSLNPNYSPLLDTDVNVFLVRESDMRGKPSWFTEGNGKIFAQGIKVNFLDKVYDRTIRSMRMKMAELQIDERQKKPTTRGAGYD